MECARLNPPSWLSQALSNPTITDICINGTRDVFIDQGNGLEPLPIPPLQQLKDEQLRNWILAALSEGGKTWDAKYPFVDLTLSSGHRIHVTFPPLSQYGILVSIRRLPQTIAATTKPIPGQIRWRNSPFYAPLAKAVRAGDSILISGSTGSGKTTLATDLLGEVPPHERIIALEDTSELAPHHSHFISLLSRPPNADGFGEITLRDLLRQTLRMRPDRIILGECRGKRVLDLLQTLNTGHRGAMATLHANSPRDALRRIELLCLLASNGSISSSVIRELLTLGIQWIVQVKRENSSRRISELWRIEGREGDTILLRQMLE